VIWLQESCGKRAHFHSELTHSQEQLSGPGIFNPVGERVSGKIEEPEGGFAVKRKRYSVEQIVAILRLGVPVAELIRQAEISEQTFYRWKKHSLVGNGPGSSVAAGAGRECTIEAPGGRTDPG